MTKKGPSPPSVRHIQRLRDEANSQGKTQRARWDHIADVRRGQHALSIPDGFKKTTKEVKIRIIADTIRRLVSSLSINMPTIAVTPAGPGRVAQENATLREKWSTGLLEELDCARLPFRPFRGSMDHGVSFGLAVWKLVYTPYTWHDYPTARVMFGKGIGRLDKNETESLGDAREMYKQGRIPLAWQSVDPRTWWGFMTEGGLRESVEVTKRTIASIEGDYGVAYDLNLGKFNPEQVSPPYVQQHEPSSSTEEQREFIEHWDRDWVTYMVDDVVLKQFQHGYRRVPYFPFFGLSNSTEMLWKQAESVVEQMVDKETELDELLTMKHNWAHLAAYPMGTIEGPQGTPGLAAKVGPDGKAHGQLMPEIGFKAGVFKGMPPGWKMGWIVPPNVGQDLSEMIQFLVGELKEAVPNVLKGMGGPEQAGYAINQLMTAARQVYDPIRDNASLAIQEMIKFVWWLLEHKIKEKIYILGDAPTKGRGKPQKKWLGLGPKDIFGYYQCTARIVPLLPSNRIAEGSFFMQQWQGGGIPRRMYLEEGMHIPNPEEVMEERVVEDMVYSGQGPLFDAMVKRALERSHELDVIEEAERKARLAAMPLPPGVEEMLAQEQGLPGEGAAMPGVPAPENLAAEPGLNMPLEGAMPGMAPMGGPPPPGGRPAGVERQPSTLMLPGGIPGEM